MALFSAGSSQICHLVASVSNVNRPVLLVHILLRCPPRLCPRSTTLRHVHYSAQCPHSLNYHLYADDTQLFLSFLPAHLDSSIDHLHNALDRISSWMTANLLTLNSSKTEFLLIVLSKQLAKINNSTLLATWASYLMNTSLFLTRSHLSPNLAITISVSFTVSVRTSIPKQLPPSPLPLFTPSSITATLFITTCPSFRSRTLLHVLLSKLPNPATSLPSSGLWTG